MSVHDDLKNWYHNQNYDEVCRFYDQVSNILEVQPSEWDFVYIMNSLYKKQRYDDCLTLYKICKKAIRECDKLNDKMGWCVYHLYLKNFDFKNGDHKTFFRRVDYVLNNVEDGKYSSVHFIAKLAVKAILDGSSLSKDSYCHANKYLDCVNYKELDKAESVFESEGKTFTVASDYEWWFSTKSKCLFKLQNYMECIKICDEALETIEKFHSNNDSWFRYRKATCLLELKRISESKKIAEDIIRHGFHHWIVYYLLYEISVAENNVPDAMKYAGYCSLADRNHEMRVKFYERYASFLEAQGETTWAMLHAHFAQLIRQEKNWKLTISDIDEKILKLNRNETLNRLKPFWEKNRDIGKVFVTGVISKILPPGKTGFVKDDKTGKEYYFNFRDASCDRRQLVIGTKVRFVLEERFDKSKNISKTNAVELRLC